VVVVVVDLELPVHQMPEVAAAAVAFNTFRIIISVRQVRIQSLWVQVGRVEMDPLLPEARMDFRPNLWKLFHSVGVAEVVKIHRVCLEGRAAEVVGLLMEQLPVALEHTVKVIRVVQVS
jgi:hypothetical protein